MMASVLSDVYRGRWHKAPIRVLARSGGIYRLPVLVHQIDFRFEDNKSCDLRRVIGLNSSWVAHHPLDDYYIISIGGTVEATHATRSDIRALQHEKILPPDVYHLPEEGDAAWWEWVLGINAHDQIIKAPKRPRPGEPTPEQIDEQLIHHVRTHAYYLWREAGSPISDGREFWIRAEANYISCG